MIAARALDIVYENDDFQITGISVSKSGRLFANFPRWSDRYLHAVVEIRAGHEPEPYPDLNWNQWNLKPATAGEHFVCVQSVVVDAADRMWVVDAAAPLLTATVPGGPKLVQIDLATDRVARVFHLSPDVVLADSYLNDIRVDTNRNIAYLTDSGHGGLIVVDLTTGSARRALDGHPSVLVEDDVAIVVDGKELLFNGKPPQFNADGIALSPDGEFVYYKPVTATTLSRVPTAILRDPSADAQAQAAAVDVVATLFPTDGLWMTADGLLYLTDVTRNAVSRRDPDGNVEIVVRDPALQWPDTLTEGPDGWLYVSASHINNSPPYNAGRSTRTRPYTIFRFRP